MPVAGGGRPPTGGSWERPPETQRQEKVETDRNTRTGVETDRITKGEEMAKGMQPRERQTR